MKWVEENLKVIDHILNVISMVKKKYIWTLNEFDVVYERFEDDYKIKCVNL